MLLIKDWKVVKEGRADGYYSVGDTVEYEIEKIDNIDDIIDEITLLMPYRNYQVFGPKGKTHPEGYRSWHAKELYPNKADLKSELDKFIDTK